ncbi:nuclear transport factor 2 family protein [Halioxenophilus sp. WMMB6]|uniref:nuclear transport factor 2 family protein n=1 Tax=Halioxenophilus sp. WMMB6 TaxID=3073815 RepID=UPI00295F5907|nr:nuclear transport factor 2 family protein [Halioxenophilus sp. WMMB6]
MSNDSNKELVVSSWMAIADGEIGKFLSNVHDDIQWEILGEHPFSGVMRGPDDVLNKLLLPLGDLLDGGLAMNVSTATAEGGRVVMEVQGTSRTANGKDYNNNYCIVVELKDGKIHRVREYTDTYLIVRTFS